MSMHLVAAPCQSYSSYFPLPVGHADRAIDHRFLSAFCVRQRDNILRNIRYDERDDILSLPRDDYHSDYRRSYDYP